MRASPAWIALGWAAAIVVAGCKPDGQPKPQPEAVAASTKVTKVDAAPAAPVTPPADAAPATEPLDSFPGFRFVAKGETADDSLADKLQSGLKSVAACDDSDGLRIEVAHADVNHGAPGVETVVASMSHGLFVMVGEEVKGRSADGVGTCEGSQAELGGLWIGQVVPDPEPEMVVIDTFGGRNMGATTMTIYKDPHDGKPIAPIFSAELASLEDGEATSYAVELAADGTIVADTADGKVGHGWDPVAFKFVAKGPAK